MRGTIVLLSAEENKDSLLALAAQEGVEVQWVDTAGDMDAQASGCRNAVAVIASPSAFPIELARACPKLKLVQVSSAGTDRMDLQALGELGIRVANNGGGNAVAVAEHTIALIVGVYRKLRLQFESVMARNWAGDVREEWFRQAHELTGKTVGIVGAGRIGREVAQRLQGWDCDLIYSDAFQLPEDEEARLKLDCVSLDTLLSTSDVVTLHVPLTKQTRAMIGDRELRNMKASAILINACRGPVVDEAALIRALRDGAIAGAGLDVLEEEPTPPDNPLLDMENVLVTPHMASLSQEAFEKSRRFAIENGARVAAGEEPQSIVHPE